MDNKDVNELIDAFVGYREMLAPIQSELHEFLDTYTAISEDVKKLNAAFSGDVKENLSKIYGVLSGQAERAEELTKKVDQFLLSSNKYTEQVENLINTMGSIESVIKKVDEIELKAEEQIERLNAVVEDKRRNYNLKDLEKSLDQYNANLQTVGDFINKQVAQSIADSNKTLQSIKDGSENVSKKLEEEKKSVAELLQEYKCSNELLKKVVEKNDVNQSYIFDILDEWAKERRVKVKK